MTKAKLTPPDRKQCQALKPNGNSFMTLGGRPGHERCTEKPTVIVQEREPNKTDGKIGSMALCSACYFQARKQLGESFSIIEFLP